MANHSLTEGRPAPFFRIGIQRPWIMGVLNLTPDSFSDGGDLWRAGSLRRDQLLQRAEGMVADGANILDLGGESTRPGASAPDSQAEIDRVLPALELLRANLDVKLSVDTSSPEVMRAATEVGVDLINDVRALERGDALAVAAASGVPVCLMHMQGQPQTMQLAPQYRDVVAEVKQWLLQRCASCEDAGIAREKLLIDPGFGFGKSLAHNLQLFNALPVFVASGYPVLVGVSRKSMLGTITGRPVDRRATASAVMAAMATRAGAAVLRVHDVAETSDAVNIALALMENEQQ